MDDYLKVLLLVGGRLEQAGIPYMLSGSTAMNFYARPRMTRDVDIVVEMGTADIVDALPALDWGYMAHWARELGIDPLLEQVKR